MPGRRGKRMTEPAEERAERSAYADILEDGWADDVELRDFDITRNITLPPGLEFLDDEEESGFPVGEEQSGRSGRERASGVSAEEELSGRSGRERASGWSEGEEKSGWFAAEPSGRSAGEGRRRRRRAGKKGSPAFRVFLLLWLAGLIVLIAYGLGYFYDFLEDYEAEYRASRPEVAVGELLGYFRARDMEAIYHMLSEKPELNAYETEEELRAYMESLLMGAPVSAAEAGAEYSAETPVYYIKAGDYIIAKAVYRKAPTTRAYGFPEWYLSQLEYYTDAAGSLQITAPENVTVCVNGIALTEAERSAVGDAPTAQRYVEEYMTLPVMVSYECGGFYQIPQVTATAEDGTELPLSGDPESGVYRVEYPRDCAERAELEAYAIAAVSAYADFVSGDLAEEELTTYFTPDNIYLYYLEHAELKYFTRHSGTETHNAEVRDFVAYSGEMYYCEVYLEQWLTMNWGSAEPEVVPTDGKFYFVRLDGEWKVAAIEF